MDRLQSRPTGFCPRVLRGHLREDGTFRVYSDAFNLASAYQHLGEIYEAKGDRKKAVKYYEKLLALWKNADAELQPSVRAAKARVARLSGAPGRVMMLRAAVASMGVLIVTFAPPLLHFRGSTG